MNFLISFHFWKKKLVWIILQAISNLKQNLITKFQPMKKIKNIRMVSSFQLDKIMKNQAIKVIILFMIQILLHLDYKQNLILKYIFM